MLKLEKIINFCPTGNQTTSQNSLAPIYPNKIIEEVLACNEVGITLVHLHARDDTGANTYRKEVFQMIIEGIKSNAPDLTIGVSLSGRYVEDKYLRSEVLSLYPDLASLTMSSLNFPQSPSINSPDTILWLIEEMDKYGVNPEIECFDTGMLNYTKYLISQGKLPRSVYINIILGNLFNAGSDLVNVSSIIHHLPTEATVCFGGIGKAQLKANVLGLLEVDGVRVGLEDNYYLFDKKKATNLELVQQIHRLMREFNFTLLDTLSFKKNGFKNRKA